MNTDWVKLLNSATEDQRTDAVAQLRAGQILAEMLGTVCHPEYYHSGHDQTVSFHYFSNHLTLQGIVVHFDGFHVSVYFAVFPAQYLRTVRDINLNDLEGIPTKDKIKLNHTRIYNLVNTVDRTEFIKEFVALVRYIAAGEANVGFLGKTREEIHRIAVDRSNVDDGQVERPPQQDLNDSEEKIWRISNENNYTI